MMDAPKRHAPPLAVVAEIELALADAFRGQPVGGYLLAMDAVEKGLREANAKNLAGDVGYV